MKRILIVALILGSFLLSREAKSQSLPLDSLPVRGICLEAPQPADIDAFVKFIRQELHPRKINTIILRVDYNYDFKSHPELRDTAALGEADVKKMVSTCRELGIQLIPEIDLLGHQSWANHLGKLLEIYPQFDETPWVKIPAKYEWPNEDNLYCKSYCPLAPGLHEVIFDLIDELC